MARHGIYFPDANDIITRACIRYLDTWLMSPLDSKTKSNIRDVLGDPNILAKKSSIAKIKLGGLDTVNPDCLGQMNVVPSVRREKSSSNVRRLFNIDRSGLGSGKQLVLLSYASDKLWYHARRAPHAQRDVSRLLARSPVLCDVMEGSDCQRGRYPFQTWMDAQSAFCCTLQSFHYGLVNSAQLSEHFRTTEACLSGSDVFGHWESIDTSPEELLQRYASFVQSCALAEMALRQRVYLTFASQLYFGRSEINAYADILLDFVRICMLRTVSLPALLQCAAKRKDAAEALGVRLSEVRIADGLGKSSLHYWVQGANDVVTWSPNISDRLGLEVNHKLVYFGRRISAGISTASSSFLSTEQMSKRSALIPFFLCRISERITWFLFGQLSVKCHSRLTLLIKAGLTRLNTLYSNQYVSVMCGKQNSEWNSTTQVATQFPRAKALIFQITLNKRTWINVS